MNKQLSYRPDIDGLRAVAVGLVIAFHAFPDRVPGGYVGVDIFFVISGFLITGLLLDDLKRKQFSFSGFYARRIRRIFPALIAVLAVCFAAGWFLLLPREFKSLGLNIFGGAAFSSNLVLLGQTSYFDVAAAQKPLLHLWSLGVEEQFYIVWPILLLLAFSRRASVVILALVLFAASFAWNVKDVGTAAGFYLPLTRAWELMIGGMMAAAAGGGDKLKLDQAWHSLRSAVNRMVPKPVADVLARRDLYTLIGLALIAVAVFGLSKDSDFPGWWALPPTLGAALIVAAQGAWLNRVVLANRAVVLVGLISYPLYLWHWPLLSFATVVDPAGPSASSRLAAVAAAVVLAFITYRWIELPIRTGQRRHYKVAGLCVAMLAVGAVGLGTFYAQGFYYRIPPAIRDMATLRLDPVFEKPIWRLDTCLLDGDETHFGSNCIERDRRPLLFLWGDSYASAFYPGLKRLQSSYNFGIAQFTTAGCPPLLAFTVAGRPHCVENNDFVFSVLPDARPDIVVLYSAWNYGNIVNPLKSLIAKLHALNVPRIIVMGPPPDWDGGLPQAAYEYYMHDPLHRMIPMQSDFRVSKAWYGYQKQFAKDVMPMGTEFISVWDALCNGLECRTRLGDKATDLMAFDFAHLTVSGSTYLAQTIAPCLFPDQQNANAPVPERPSACHWPDSKNAKSANAAPALAIP